MIANGSTVKMHYTLTVDGAVLDSSAGGEPLEFVQGEGHIIPGLEKEIGTFSQGDKKHVTVSAENGYGEKHPELVQKVPKDAFGPKAGELKVGAVVGGQTPNGVFQAVVAEIADSEVTLDLNHPLAGKTLDFDVEIVSVQPPKSKLILP